MSTIKANAYLDSSGGNTATINGSIPGGMTLLGTLTTTSGSTQTLSSLVLTSYKSLHLVINGVSFVTGTASSFSVGAGIVQSNSNSTDFLYGIVDVDLTIGIAVPNITRGPLPAQVNSNQIAQTGYSTSTTSISVSISTSTFDAGSVLIYGVK